MRKTFMKLTAALCCLLCLAALSIYAIPQGTQRVDWSMMTEREQQGRDEGWTVYVMRAGQKVLLEGKNGRYAGCEPGETFYYARTWDAQIAKPVLRIHAIMSSIAVWIDDELQYADTPLPEKDAGDLVLPMLKTDRSGAVEIPLHTALYGHTLTIAQASPMESETGYAYVYPCDVDVISTYGYERDLIAQANRVGLTELMLCGLAALMCYLACKRGDGVLLLLALLAVLRLLGVIADAAFFYQYTTLAGIDLGVFVNRLSFSVMLGFLALKCARKRFPMVAMAVLHALSSIAALVVQAVGLTNDTLVAISFLPDQLTLVCWVGAVIFAAVQARGKNPFFRLFERLMLTFAAVGAVMGVVYLLVYTDTWARLLAGQVYVAILLRGAVVWIMQGAGIGAAVLLAVKQLRAVREEKVFAAVRAQAVEQSYESLQQHQKDVMTLRHEIRRHDLALKGFLDEGDTARAKDYLAALLEEQEQISQVLHTDNSLINIILGSRVAIAESHGLSVELVRMDVPPKLPLSDKETVSLVLNIVDNAIEAAQKARPQPGLLRLDMHQKNSLFVFTCENAMPEAQTFTENTGLNIHGYGLRIVERILEPFGSLMTTRMKDGVYSVTIALPLGCPAGKASAQAEHDAPRTNVPL